MAEPMPTYHVDIWTIPEPTYVCCLCIPTARYSLEGVTTHLREVHDSEAIPTPNMEQLLAIRTESDARAAAAAAQVPGPAAEVPPRTEGEATSATPGPPAPHDEPAAPGETSAPASPAPPEESPRHA